ncbi:MAG: hypothetical protein EPO21_20475 [Chloroflexota bacterium]|nr:MAG: hypothetical protein EPO21_20475 [Chloroflexota bacterium]
MNRQSDAAFESASNSLSMLRMARAWHAADQISQAIHACGWLLARHSAGADARGVADRARALDEDNKRQGQYLLGMGVREKVEQYL